MTLPFVEALAVVGDSLYERGDDAGARDLWRRCLRDAVAIPEGRTLQAHLRLRLGDAGGWADYDARWDCRRFQRERGRPEYATIPAWRGESLVGQRLLVHAEQGHGDWLQMARYLPWLGAAGAALVVEVLPALVRLARASFPDATVFARGAPLPGAVDCAVPSMSLPARFGGRFPAAVPYLTAPGERPPPCAGLVRAGIVWAGSAGHANDRARSLAVETLAPLWRVPGVQWTSLQVGDRAHEAKRTPCYAPSVGDFADTAAVVKSLDLVIAVDTSTAHLAGALGVPTWLLLPRLSDHRWELDRADSPWYPSMRVYRQPVAGDWASVVARVADDLSSLLRG